MFVYCVRSCYIANLVSPQGESTTGIDPTGLSLSHLERVGNKITQPDILIFKDKGEWFFKRKHPKKI